MSNFQFGGLPVPGSNVVLPLLDLNDRVNWRIKSFTPRLATTIETARQNWRGQSSRIAGDRSPLTIDIGFQFDEQRAGRVLAIDHATFSQSGEQWLQISPSQRVLVEFTNIAPTVERRGLGTKLYGGMLSFLARKGYAEDIAASTLAAVALAGSVGAGTATGFNVTYSGSVLTRPVWTITIPIGNTVTITQIKLQNTLSGEILTLNFSPALLANTAYTITIDGDAYTIKDQNSVSYDPLGSFPKLYPPVGTVNTFSATVVTGSGTSTGVTITASFRNRWEVQA